MFTTEMRMQKLLAANSRVLARIDQILSGEDSTSGKREADVSTCTITDGARRLGVSRPTLYRMIQTGKVRAISLNGSRGRRVVVASLVDYVNGRGA